MIRRRIVLAYWVIAISLFIPNAAYAYIDPATTTYLIQIATALVVTVGVSLSIFLYRFKMISSKIKFWIYGLLYRSRRKGREEARETERRQAEPYALPAYAMPGAENPPAPGSFDPAVRAALDERLEEKAAVKPGMDEVPQTYAGRIRMMLPLVLAFSFSFIVVGCLELAIQYAPEIPFRISVIVPVVILFFAAVSGLLLVILPILKGRALEAILSIGLAILIAGYLQGNFLNRGIGELTGDALVWSSLKPQIIASLICWAGAFVLIGFLWRRARRVWRNLILFVPFLVILLQGVAFVSVINENANNTKWGAGVFWQTADETLTIDRINEVAYGKNAILIVLDRLDQEFIEEIAADDPGFFDPLDGFTEFDDFIQYAGSTFPAVTGYLTGHRYLFDMPRVEYFEYAWANAEFFLKLKELGIDIRLYVDRGSAFSSASQLGGIASNTFEGELTINKRVALVKLLKLAGYRYAPMPLKHYFWLSPYEFVDTMVLTDKTAPYMVNDFAYYASLTLNGLSASGDDPVSFKYLHLQGPHPPLNMDENMQFVEESTLTGQTKGSYRIVYEYLRQLKELGLYEDAVIIIMGDHGNYLGDDLTRPARAGLMVKPAGSAGTPLEKSHAPVSPDQLHATLFEGLFGDTGGFGDTFFDINEGDEMFREYSMNLWRYEITGDGRDFSNWEFVGLFPDTYR